MTTEVILSDNRMVVKEIVDKPSDIRYSNKMKICRKCKQTKLAEEFQVDNRLPSGRTMLCRVCAAKEANDWHKANREHHNKKMKVWRDADKIMNMGKYLFRIAKRRAKETSRAFTIHYSDVIVPEFCPALGMKLEFTPGKYSPNCPSIDALIPEKGYIPGNIAVISHRANSIKNNATPEELRKIADWLEKVLQSGAPSPSKKTDD